MKRSEPSVGPFETRSFAPGGTDLDGFRSEIRHWLEQHSAEWATPDDEDLAARLARARDWQALKYRSGYAGLAWPEDVGGRGLGLGEQLIWDAEAAQFDVPEPVHIVSMMIAGPTIDEFGTTQQRQEWLPPILRGEQIWCQLFSEPAAGSDLASARTTAIRTAIGSWLVNGQKVWTSGAHYADRGILLARTSDQHKHAGLSMFVVDMHAPGIECRPIRQMTGEAHFNAVFFDDVELPADALLAEPGQGWTIARAVLKHERLGLLARRRVNIDAFVRVIRGYLTRDPALIEPALTVRAARLLLRAELLEILAQRDFDAVVRGDQAAMSGSVGKLAVSRLMNEVADCAVSMLGVTALVQDNGWMGYWSTSFLEAPSRRLAGGTDEIQRSLIAEQQLGFPRTRTS